MTTLPLRLEDIEGVYILHALDLPGCYSEGATEGKAIRNFASTLASYRDWLVTHGELVPVLPEEFDVAERLASYTLADGYEVNAIFEPERSPPSWEFLTLSIRLLRYSGADLLSAFESIPIDQREASLAVGARTPKQILEHVARAEWWYLSHLADVPGALPGDQAPGTPAQFEAVHATLIEWLTDIPAERMGAIVVDREEEWSVRKLLRRALWHERAHTAELARFGTAVSDPGRGAQLDERGRV